MAINKSVSKQDINSATDHNLLGDYFDHEVDTEYLMMQLESEADRATRAIEQISQHTPPKGTFGKLMHRLSKLFTAS